MNDNINSRIFIEDSEINLKDMLFFICKKWRGLLFTAAALMVLLILVKIPVLSKLNGIGTILKQLAKYALVGILSGLILMFFIYAVSYAVNGKIKSENDFKSNCRLNILGVLPKRRDKKLNVIDKLIRTMFGIDRYIDDFEELTDRLAEEILAVISVGSTDKIGTSSCSCIAVVSTESDETAGELVKLINSKLNKTSNISLAGNILKNAESIRTVMKSDKVILAERITASKYQDVKETYKKLTTWEKDVVGIVLFNGDAK